MIMATSKLKIQHFRANDLVDNGGKQFEMGKGWCEDFLGISSDVKEITIYLIFKPISKAHKSLDGTKIELLLSEVNLRGDRKAYTNTENGGNSQIKDFFIAELVPEMLYSKKIYIHCDLSKSGDMTGISAVAVLGYKNQERYDDTGQTNTLKEIVFRHVFSVGLQCPPNDELSMIKVKDFLHYLKYDLGWNIAGVSCDGYQSLMLLQSLQLDGFTVKEVSMDIIKNKECVGYTAFRNVLVEQRIKLGEY